MKKVRNVDIKEQPTSALVEALASESNLDKFIATIGSDLPGGAATNEEARAYIRREIDRRIPVPTGHTSRDDS